MPADDPARPARAWPAWLSRRSDDPPRDRRSPSCAAGRTGRSRSWPRARSRFPDDLIGGSVANVQAPARGATDLLSNAGMWVKPGGPENVYTTQPFEYAEISAISKDSAASSSVLPWQDSFLDLPGRRVWVLGVPSQRSAQIAPSQLLGKARQDCGTRSCAKGAGWRSARRSRANITCVWSALHTAHPRGQHELSPGGHHRELRLAVGRRSHERRRAGKIVAKRTATQLAVALQPGRHAGEAASNHPESASPGSALTARQSATASGSQRGAGQHACKIDRHTIIVLVSTIVSVIALMLARSGRAVAGSPR